MKLIILVISPSDSVKVNNYLHKAPVFYLKIASIGGIVSNGTYTYLIKVMDESCAEVVKRLGSLCKTRKVEYSSESVEFGFFQNISTSQKMGGCVMFVVPLEQFIKN